MIERLRRPLEWLLFAVLPIAVAVAMFATAHSTGSLAADFHNELYPEAKLLLEWKNPFPGPGAELQYGHNLIWPPVAALVVAPFTILSPGAADWLVALVGLACFMASLRIVGVRDWRVYGAFALWPSVIGEIRVSHLTPVLCLLLAVAWRFRDSRVAPGLAVGLASAIKFFLWPIGIWLAAIGRALEVVLAVAVAGASVLLILPFTGLHEYFRVSDRPGADIRSGQSLCHTDSSSRSACRKRSRVSRRSPLGTAAPPRLLAPGEPGDGGRGGARPLTDRVARLLRDRGDPTRNRPDRASRACGSFLLRRGGSSEPGSAPPAAGVRHACWSYSASCSPSSHVRRRAPMPSESIRSTLGEVSSSTMPRADSQHAQSPGHSLAGETRLEPTSSGSARGLARTRPSGSTRMPDEKHHP